MTRVPEEKRKCPRLKANLKVDVSEKTSCNSIDLSEGGLSFSSIETIASPQVSLKISFTKEFELKADAKLVWKRDLADGVSSYGVEFVGLTEPQKAALRKELIKTQVKGLLDEIKDPGVKDNVANFFLKDMLDYVNEINRIIASASNEPGYSYELERKFAHLNNQILLKGFCLEELIENKSIMDTGKQYFRSLVGAWAYKSPIVKRAFEKPRGYPGDYLMLEAIYNNVPLIKSSIGLYFDKYFLNSPYAVALRYRKDRLREILKNEIQNSALKTVRIFNIACGSCREIKELPSAIFKDKNVIFTCLDWDEEAIAFSQQALKGFPPNAAFNFAREDIMDFIKVTTVIESFAKQDLMYAAGVIDYLPDNILKLFIRCFFGLLKKEGKLILTHKNKEKNFSPLPLNWFCDWSFVPRSKDEVARIFYDSGINNFSFLVETDEFNDIFYFYLTRH